MPTCTLIRLHYIAFSMAIAAFAIISSTASAVCRNDLGGTTRPTSDFTINGDGTVTDARTGLQWTRCYEGETGSSCQSGVQTGATWSAALATATASTFAGYTDWRLPNIKELESLNDYRCTNPSINTEVFPSLIGSVFSIWSSTPNPFAGYAFVTDIGGSEISKKATSTTALVRLVRAGNAYSSLVNLTNGVCGAADGVATATPPALATLCTAGTPSTVTSGATNYVWTCTGANGGVDRNCSAPKTASAVTLSLPRISGAIESVAHGDGHLGARMDNIPRMQDTLRISCSSGSCTWSAMVVPTPVAWLKVNSPATGVATTSTPSELSFSVNPFEETTNERVAYIQVTDGTGTPKTWKVTQRPLTDWDEDGVADEWEQRGYPTQVGTRLSLAGNYLKPTAGCRFDEVSPQSNVCKRSTAPYGNIVGSESASDEQRKAARDIWLWLDQMTGLETDQETRSSVVPRVAKAFQRNNIAVRWLSSIKDFSATLPESIPDLNDAAQIAALKQINFIRASGAASRAYRYVVWGKKFSFDGVLKANSGLSVDTSNTIFVAAGAGTTNGLNGEGLQTGTLMHELGHNLGLGHGGPWYNADRSDLTLPDYDSNNSNKPNHISVMSYTYQFPGLVVSDPSMAYDYDSHSWDTVDEGILSTY